MGEIRFSSSAAMDRYKRCSAETESKGDRSLQGCIDRLKQWNSPIIIGCDFDERSFTFREELTAEQLNEGYHPISGGIIYHGPRDGYGSGSGPTFSVTLGRSEGYSIHT